MSDAQTAGDLQDALQELLAAAEAPDAEALEEILRRYPEHAAEVTEFAVEWALQDLLPATDDDDGASGSKVPAAMARFRARLDQLDAPSSSATPQDPFADRSPTELVGLATRLGLDKILVAKLRDRKILGETVPRALQEGLATELGVSPAVIAAHLTAPPTIPHGANFKAQRAPEAAAKESFEQAVRRSSLAEGEQGRWLSPPRD